MSVRGVPLLGNTRYLGFTPVCGMLVIIPADAEPIDS